jgi:hypothetical protein
MDDRRFRELLEHVIKASQGNADHLSGEARDFAREFNLLAGDVDFLYDALGIERESGGGDHDDAEPSSAINLSQDHGELEGLGDDDHPQYTTDAEATVIASREARRVPVDFSQPDEPNPFMPIPVGSGTGGAGTPGADGAPGAPGQTIPFQGEPGEDGLSFFMPGPTGATGADSVVPGPTGPAGTSIPPFPLVEDPENYGMWVPGGAAAAASSVTGFPLTTISPTSLSGNTDDWNPTGLSTAQVIRVNSSVDVNLTGIVAQAAGTAIWLHNIGSKKIKLKHDVTSTAANRFYCAGSVDRLLRPNASRYIVYDGTSSRWRVESIGAGGGGAGSGGTAAAGPIDWPFGDGSDGSLNFDGTNQYPWLATLSGSTYTLTRDVMATNITVASGKIVISKNWRMFATGTVDVSGTIHCDGGNASGTSGGVAQTAGYYVVAGQGGTGASAGGNPGNPGTNSANAIGGPSAMGAPGPDNVLGNNRYFGATQSNNAPAAAAGGNKAGSAGIVAFNSSVPDTVLRLAGGQSGGGGGDNTTVGVGGGGGAGGGIVYIAADTIIVESGGVIRSNGGNGAAGSSVASRNDGGGAGGSGGVVCLVSRTLTNSGTIQASGGTGGASNYGLAVQTVAAGLATSDTAASRTTSGVVENFHPPFGGPGAATISPPPIAQGGYVLVAINALRSAGASAAPTLSGWGGTWVNHTSKTFSTNATPLQRLSVYGSFIPSNITLQQYWDGLTATFAAAQDAVSFEVFMVWNVDQTTPVVQTAVANVDANTTLTATLAAFGNANNGTIGIGGAKANSPTWTAGTSMVLGLNLASGGTFLAQTPGQRFEATQGEKDAVAITVGAATDLALIALEMKAAATPDNGSVGYPGLVLEFDVGSGAGD